MMRKFFLCKIQFLLLLVPMGIHAVGVGGSGMFPYSVELRGYISKETGKSPVAYLWISEKCRKVKAIIFCQQNMTEEALYKMPSFQRQLAEMGIAVIWVAPAFSNNWDPSTGCQNIFEEMMTGLAGQSGHPEIEHCPVIPFGHSAQATFPWNFAAWNNSRTLCIISFHGDAPRTNLCGYGTANVEWGRTRNSDGMPGLMVEGEYEWWEARVNPALAFRMMYPQSCISFLCDAGHGHFDCAKETADYIARFIRKSLEQRLQPDGTLRKINPQDGWLADRFRPDLPGTDGADKGTPSNLREQYVPVSAASYRQYQGDKHDAFWYFDREMALLTEKRYQDTYGKKLQFVGIEQGGSLLSYDTSVQGGMRAGFLPEKDGITFHLKAVYTDASHQQLSLDHGKGKLHVEVICGPVRKINDTTFRIYPYEAGWDNSRRSFSIWLAAVADPDQNYKRAVQPVNILLPHDIMDKLK